MKICLFLMTLICLWLGGCRSRPSDTLDWRNRFDFDGDGNPDQINYKYSGGANCCYWMEVKLSYKGVLSKVPYSVNGGYVIFDLSNPDNFTIDDFDGDGRAEMFISLTHLDKEERGGVNCPGDAILLRYGRGDKWIAECP